MIRSFIGIILMTTVLMSCADPSQVKKSSASNGPTSLAVSVNETDPNTRSTYISGGERSAFFGDLHVHTRNSFDAYIFEIRATPDDAYRFAKGETIDHPVDRTMTIWGGPLDFLAVTDHGEYLGAIPRLNDPSHELGRTKLAEEIFGENNLGISGSFRRVGITLTTGVPLDEIYRPEVTREVWGETVDAANTHYEPGSFTTFAGYEYTSAWRGRNLHRNVIFKDMAPETIFTALNSPNPENLWEAMDEWRLEGMEVLSIPHNSNGSSGQMFKLETFDGAPLDADYAEQRMRNEPIVEIIQVKGASETHPLLSPNDEWAGFENFNLYIGANLFTEPDGGYVRQALKRGTTLDQEQGFNPFKFGIIGSSDSHVAAGAYNEADYWSKVGVADGTPVTRGSAPPDGALTWDGVAEDDLRRPRTWNASGLAGVWAEENTRESLFAAMQRKETFATSGPRIKVRMFGGFALDALDLSDPDLALRAQSLGVPMGGDLLSSEADERSPTFLAWAQRDTLSMALDRVQIIKVWTEADGTSQEQVFDVACADERVPDDRSGLCAPSAAKVDPKDCSTSEGVGAGELIGLWTDPTFKPDQNAAYYIRVLENPSCRWSTWDALYAGVTPNPSLAPTIVERAWGSPIWYSSN